MADLNDLTKPDLESTYANGNVPDTLLGHIKRLWLGDYTGMANLVPGMMRWAVTGTSTLAARLYRRNSLGLDVEITSLPGVSIGGNAATATTATTAAACSGNAATATTAAACSGNAATATNANTVTTITTQQISNQFPTTAGGVSTYVFARWLSATGTVSLGQTVSGSDLRSSGLSVWSGESHTRPNDGTQLAGTWRSMGTANISQGSGYTLFVRLY